MKRTISLILLVIAVISFLLLSYQRRQVIGKKYLRIHDTDILVELARSDAERSKGLGYRDSLDPNTGMLFIFSESKRWDFWMEGMRFALDFIWIEDNKVADLTENILPPAQTGNSPVFVRPATEVHYVLEVNQGFVQKHQIKIGDRVEFHI